MDPFFPPVAGLSFAKTPAGLIADEDAAILERDLPTLQNDPDLHNLAAGKLNEYHAFRSLYPRPLSPEEQKQRADGYDRLEEVFTDFDKANAGHDIASLKFADPSEAGPVKDRLATAAFLRYQTGRDSSGIDRDLDRDAIAEKLFAGEGKGSDTAFAGAARNWFKKNRDTAVQRQSFADAGISDALAFDVSGHGKRLEEITSTAGVIEGMEGERDKNVAAYLQARNETEAKVAPYRRTAKSVLEMLKVSGGKVEGMSDANLGYDPMGKALDMMMQVPPEVRPLLLRMVATEPGKDTSGSVAKGLSAAGRGLASMFGGFADANRRRAIQQFQREVNSGAPIEIPAQWANDPEGLGKLATWKTAGKIEGPDGSAGRPVLATPEQRAQLADLGAQEMDRFLVAQELEGVLQQSVDPVEGEGKAGKIGVQIANSLGSMVPSFIPVIGPVIAQGGFADQEFTRLTSLGVKPEIAGPMSDASGAAQGALDKAQALFAFKLPFLKGLGASAPMSRAAGSGLAQATIATAGVQAAEYTTEIAQDLVPTFTAAIAEQLGMSLPEQAQYGEEWKRWKPWNPDTFLVLAPLSLVGGAFQGISNAAESRRFQAELLADPVKLEAVGIAPAQAAMIAELPAQQRADAYREAYASRAPDAPAAVAARETIAAESAENTQDYERAKVEAGVKQVRRTPEGWTVDMDDGSSVTVDSAGAADAIVNELKAAGTRNEAAAMVEMVDQWTGKGGERSTTFTGAIAKGEKSGKITYFKGGKTWQVELDKKSADNLADEMEEIANGTGGEGVAVLGTNRVKFKERVAEGAKEIVRVLDTSVNQGDRNVLTLLHEQVESVYRAGLSDGSITPEETLAAIQAIAPALDPSRVPEGDAEGRSFRERVQRIAGGTATETEIRETVSELIVADQLGKRKNGEALPAGAITAGIDAAIRSGSGPQRSALQKFRAFLKAAKLYFRAVLGTAAALSKARRDGKIKPGDAWENYVDKLLEVDVQQKHESDVAAEIEEDFGDAFSLGRAEPLTKPEVSLEFPDGSRMLGPATFAIRAFHGTPHKVDRFTTAKIGTGEGAQVYGWGLYFAENKGIAEWYKKTLSSRSENVRFEGKNAFEADDVGRWLLGVVSGSRQMPKYDFEKARAEAIESAQEDAALQSRLFREAKEREGTTLETDAKWGRLPAIKFTAEHTEKARSAMELAQARLKKAQSMKESDFEWSEGNLYEVEIAPDEDAFLDWDNPIWGQPPTVQDAIQNHFGADSAEWKEVRNVPGAFFHDSYIEGRPKEKSDLLRNLGIAGIKYRDASSRLQAWIEDDENIYGERTWYVVSIHPGNKSTSRTSFESEQEAENYLEEIQPPAVYNFVLFDDSLVKIVAENGKPVQQSEPGDAGWWKEMQTDAGQSFNVADSDRWAAMLARIDREKQAQAGGARWRIDGVQKGFDENDNIIPKFQQVTILDPAHPAVGSTLSIPLEGRAAPLPDEAIAAAVDAKAADLGASFAPGAVGTLERIAEIVSTRFARDPERRRVVARQINASLQDMAFRWSTERKAWIGGKERNVAALGEYRSAKSLDKEQAFREATAAAEGEENAWKALSASALAALGMDRADTGMYSGTLAQRFTGGKFGLPGRIMSKRDAAKYADSGEFALGGEYDGAAGLPPSYFGGSLSVDNAAQEAYEAGEIADPYPDTLWEAIAKERQTQAKSREQYDEALAILKAERVKVKAAAKAQAAEWRKGVDEKQAKDYEPTSALLRDLRTLDAILAAVPPELRAKVGGFIKIAGLKTNAARAEEIIRRVDKLDKLLEQYLQAETYEAMVDLILKAAPDREAGKQSRGNLGAEGHRYFDKISEVLNLSPEEVESRQDALEKQQATGDLTDEQRVDLYEQAQILDLFGAFAEKTAAEMDAAYLEAVDVYQTKRNRWRMVEEARLAEVGRLAGEVVATLGTGTYQRTQSTKKQASTKTSLIRGITTDLMSFAQVLEKIFGEEHPLAKRWTRKVREGFRMRNDEIRALRKRFVVALQSATGLKGRHARAALWDMGRNMTIQVMAAGEGRKEIVKVPTGVIDAWIAGTAEPAAISVDAAEAATLVADRQAQLAKNKAFEAATVAQRRLLQQDLRDRLPVTRRNRAAAELVPMTEAQGVFLTMLDRQEQYREALDMAGWDAEAITSIEGQLSQAAKDLREFAAKEYREGYAPLAAVFERMYGVNLPQIKNYAPGAFFNVGADRVVDPTGSGTVEGGYRTGMLKNRKKHAAAPKLENAFATFFGHASQTAHWRGLAEVTRELKAVMGKPEVKRSILGAHGQDMLDTVTDWIQAIEGNGIQQATGRLERFLGALVQAQTFIALAGKIGTLLKQGTAAIGVAYHIGPAAYAAGFARLMSGKLDYRGMWRSETIRRRIESGVSPEHRASIADLWTKRPSLFRDGMQEMMEVIGATDGGFTAVSATIAYDNQLREAAKLGLSGAAAENYAISEVEDILGRTAQPSDIVDRSLTELKLGNFGRLAFMFASESRQKSALWLKAVGNTIQGKPTQKDKYVLMISHLVVGPMLQAITAVWSDLRNDDDDEIFDLENWDPLDFLKAVVAGPLAGIPLIKDVTSGFGSSGPLSRVVGGFTQAEKLIEGVPDTETETAEWYKDRIVRIMQATSAEIGVLGSVVDQAFDLIDNAVDDSDEEAKQQTRRLNREKREAKGK